MTRKKQTAERKRSMAVTAAEEMGDGNKNHCAQRCSSKRVPKASAEYSEFHENPTANKGAYDSKNNVRDAAEAAAARNFSREPTGDQADQQPADDPAAVFEVNDMFIEKNGAPSCKHFASCASWNSNQNRFAGKPLRLSSLIASSASFCGGILLAPAVQRSKPPPDAPAGKPPPRTHPR